LKWLPRPALHKSYGGAAVPVLMSLCLPAGGGVCSIEYKGDWHWEGDAQRRSTQVIPPVPCAVLGRSGAPQIACTTLADKKARWVDTPGGSATVVQRSAPES
jgi:hypothetical protein